MNNRAQAECVVLIASPNAELRIRLRRTLRRTFEIYQVTDRAQMERMISKLKPAVLFIDLALRRLGGIKNLPAIQRLSSSTKIVLLTEKPDRTEEILALKAGVKGYCQRNLDPILIKKAVQMVQKGEIWVERGVISHLVNELHFLTQQRIRKSSSRLKDLTARQREIAIQIANAASNKEIAGALSISEAAVKAHLTAIFRKLGVSDRLGLALLVREKGQSSRDKNQVSL